MQKIDIGNIKPEDVQEYLKLFEVNKQSNITSDVEHLKIKSPAVQEKIVEKSYKPILVFYVGIASLPMEDVGVYMDEIKEFIITDELKANYLTFWIPIMENNSRIELLNPNLHYIVVGDAENNPEIDRMKKLINDILKSKD